MWHCLHSWLLKVPIRGKVCNYASGHKTLVKAKKKPGKHPQLRRGVRKSQRKNSTEDPLEDRIIEGEGPEGEWCLESADRQLEQH